MSITHQRFVEGFVKKCNMYGIYEDREIYDLLKEALAPEEITGAKAADKDDETYYEQAGKQLTTKDTKMKDVDEYGLSGDDERTNVEDGPDYEM